MNFSCSPLFHMKTSVFLKYFVWHCSFYSVLHNSEIIKLKLLRFFTKVLINGFVRFYHDSTGQYLVCDKKWAVCFFCVLPKNINGRINLLLNIFSTLVHGFNTKKTSLMKPSFRLLMVQLSEQTLVFISGFE